MLFCPRAPARREYLSKGQACSQKLAKLRKMLGPKLYESFADSCKSIYESPNLLCTCSKNLNTNVYLCNQVLFNIIFYKVMEIARKNGLSGSTLRFKSILED